MTFVQEGPFILFLEKAKTQLDVALCGEIEGPGLVETGSWEKGAQDKAAVGFWEENMVVLNPMCKGTSCLLVIHLHCCAVGDLQFANTILYTLSSFCGLLISIYLLSL